MESIEETAARQKVELRRAWRDGILKYGAKSLFQVQKMLSRFDERSEQAEVARLAVEIAKLNGSTDAVPHAKDAARLLAEARQAISFENAERVEREKRDGQVDEEIFRILIKPHPYMEGEAVHPDMAVPFAYVFSDGAVKLPAPPAKLRNGNKPPVPLRKSRATLKKLLRRVTIGELMAGKKPRTNGAALTLSEGEIEDGLINWLRFIKEAEENGNLPLHRYEQILWHVDAAEHDRTENARLARETKRAAHKASASGSSNKAEAGKKPVKKNRPKK